MDVLLDGGTTIQVERMVRFNETNSLSGDAYNAIEQDATIALTGEPAASLPTSKHITVAERLRIESTDVTRTYREIWGDPDQYFCGEGDLRKE